jgi:phage replication-related protein YjqB (UPF0714/DUF867 family)
VQEPRYQKNSELYADPTLVEGVDYARRLRRHERFDDSLAGRADPVRTAIIAPHGGGIETGTSELCLAVAGYHPATLEVTPPGGVTYDYWMFEGLRASGAGNGQLHVTSTGCDDGAAVSLCGGALNALALHGCTTKAAGLPPDERTVLVGGRNDTLKRYLLEAFADEVPAIDAAGHKLLDGRERANIVNRTLLRRGGQLELTTPLREAMFEENTRPRRKHTTTEVFWTFVAVCRDALDKLEAGQVVP